MGLLFSGFVVKVYLVAVKEFKLSSAQESLLFTTYPYYLYLLFAAAGGGGNLAPLRIPKYCTSKGVREPHALNPAQQHDPQRGSFHK